MISYKIVIYNTSKNFSLKI